MSYKERSANLSIYAMAFGNFAAGVSSMIVAGVLTEIAADMDVSTGQVGQLVTIYALAYAVGSPLIIALTGRVERRVMLTVALVLVSVGNGLAALAPNYGLLFVARIVTALGAATFVPLSSAVAISLVRPEERGSASAIVLTGFTVATALGLPIGAYIGLNLGWRFSFALVALLGLTGSYLVWRVLPRRVATSPVNLASFGQVFRNGLLVVILSVAILQFAGQMAVFAFISPWLQEFTSLGATGISLMLLAAGIGGIVGNHVGGLGTDRYGPRRTQLVLVLTLAATLAMLPVISTSLILGAILMFLWGFAGFGFIAPQVVRVVGVEPALSSASLSLNSSFTNIGISLGAIMGGIFIDRVGVNSLTWLGTGITILALFVFCLSWVMENSRQDVQMVPG